MSIWISNYKIGSKYKENGLTGYNSKGIGYAESVSTF